ncbi:MAG: hypothetical protein JXA20_11395, partial [Spirochaetes bacterium]|nr:hypothetical protein [Spirochaetota bacterium]
YIAGESGGVFFMPYDYPLSDRGNADPKSSMGAGEDLPAQGAFLYYTSPFGSLELRPPAEIDANEPLCFTLFVRKGGDTVKTAIIRDSVKVGFKGGARGRVDTSANNQFITIVPQETWTGPQGGELTVTIGGDYRHRLRRFGLLFFGGTKGGSFNQTFTFRVAPRRPGAMPFRVPVKEGDPSSIVEISRLAPANPAILPSYNQIGYDSLHYILGTVEGSGNRAVLWGVGGKFTGRGRETVVNPSLEVRFPMMMDYDGGLLTLYNYDGILLDMNGAWDMPIAFFRLATRVDPVSGAALARVALNAVVECDRIDFYKWFIKLLGMSELDTGLMFIAGGSDYGIHGAGVTRGAAGAGRVRFSANSDSVTAAIAGGTLKKRDHVYGILLVSEKTGRPVPVKYIDATEVRADGSGTVTAVTLKMGGAGFRGRARAYYMVDTYPAARGEVEIR